LTLRGGSYIRVYAMRSLEEVTKVLGRIDSEVRGKRKIEWLTVLFCQKSGLVLILDKLNQMQ
jgi:hypothetical protein